MGRREAFNIASHVLGALLATAGTVLLVVRPLRQGDLPRAAAMSVFGVSLVAAYVTSILFHWSRGEAKGRFRRLDRIAIYLLIVGGYTPLCLLVLRPGWGWPLLAVAVALSLVGCAIEVLASPGRELHGVSLYLILGWMAAVALKPLAAGLTPAGIGWLLAGGILYTVGAAAVRLRFVPWGHEIWHVSALAASACHFVTMFRFVS